MSEVLYSTPTFAPPEQFEHCWHQHGEGGEEPNRQPGGESGVQRAHRLLQQLKRHSSWSSAGWQQLIYGYETAFGSAIKGLQS